MTKRTSGKFRRRAQDAYDTPAEAVEPLKAHLVPGATYWEPCAGNGSLQKALPRCVGMTDIVPRESCVDELDAFDLTDERLGKASMIVTNPPWTRDILHPMIEHFRRLRPTWLLFDADWMHTRQAAPYLKHCGRIVSVGRVSWMGNGVSGFDNCAWYYFDDQTWHQTTFVGRE